MHHARGAHAPDVLSDMKYPDIPPEQDRPARGIGVQKIGPVRSVQYDLGAITRVAARRR